MNMVQNAKMSLFCRQENPLKPQWIGKKRKKKKKTIGLVNQDGIDASPSLP